MLDELDKAIHLENAAILATVSGPRAIVEIIAHTVITAKQDRYEVGVFYGEKDLLE